MAIKLEEIMHLARLARLEIDKKEAEELCSDLTSILNYVEQLNEVNLDNIEPMSHAIDMGAVLRNDVAKNAENIENYFKNTPSLSGRFIKVPLVIEE